MCKLIDRELIRVEVTAVGWFSTTKMCVAWELTLLGGGCFPAHVVINTNQLRTSCAVLKTRAVGCCMPTFSSSGRVGKDITVKLPVDTDDLTPVLYGALMQSPPIQSSNIDPVRPGLSRWTLLSPWIDPTGRTHCVTPKPWSGWWRTSSCTHLYSNWWPNSVQANQWITWTFCFS